MISAPSYSSVVWTSRVTAAFSLLVALGLTLSFMGQRSVLPLDDPQYLTLRDQLAGDVDNVALQERLRGLDVELRRAYFHQQTFRRRGAYLLAGGVAVTLVFAHWSSTMRRRLPGPKLRAAPLDRETRENRLAQFATVALVAVITTAVFVWQRTAPSLLRSGLSEVIEVATDIPNASPPEGLAAPPDAPVAPVADAEVSPDRLEVTAAANSEQMANFWPRFRGATGSGAAKFDDVPMNWDGASGDGVLWRTPIELPGVSSPIIWNDRVFLTGATVDRREVYCIDAASGQMLWSRAVASSDDDAADFKVEDATGYAAPTPATDGRHVFAIFASGDLAAFDFEGNLVWSHDFGTLSNPYGHASSLATYRDLLIIQLDQGSATDDKSRLLALRGTTGEIVWQTPRAVPASWSSPIVVDYQGQAHIITCAEPNVIAYAAEDGRELWRAECLQGDIGPSPVYDSGVVYVANDHALAAAIREGGEGDVTESHILWTAEFALPDICSPLLTDKQVLLIASYGGLVSYDRETGGAEPIWEEDLGAVLMASPSRVGDRIYLISEEGKGWVVRTHETGVERIAENDLGERCFSSPAFQPGRIYIRGEQHLFCIGKP